MDIGNINIDEIRNLDNFSGIAPLFPLSTVVFFPNTLLPLHIFEPRYKKMLYDSLNFEKMIAMALLKPGWETNYYENPEIFKVAGMGRIISSETFKNGSSNIVLYGLRRINIVEEINDDKPYRSAKIDLLENETGKNSELLKEHINYLISSWNNMLSSNQEKHKIKVNANLPIENLTDVLASILVANIFEKQKLLEETDVGKRAEMLISFLETRLKIFSITSKKKDQIKETRSLN